MYQFEVGELVRLKTTSRRGRIVGREMLGNRPVYWVVFRGTPTREPCYEGMLERCEPTVELQDLRADLVAAVIEATNYDELYSRVMELLDRE